MEPLRTCLGCRERAPQGSLVRLVRVGDAIVDATRPRLAGRGGYLHPGSACLALAVQRRALERAFGKAATLSAELTTRLQPAVGTARLD